MKFYPLICMAGMLSGCTDGTPAIPQKPLPPAPLHPRAHAAHQQALSTLQATLTQCVFIEVIPVCIPNNRKTAHFCTEEEKQELLSILNKLRPLPHTGAICAQPASWNVLRFYDKNQREISELRDWEIANERAALHPNYCEAKATMYLPAEDYAVFKQFLNNIAT